MPGPLNGVRIVELSNVVMGPFASQILGDMGAEVIKIEPPGGDIMRYSNEGRRASMGNLFLNNNRNKRSLVLNLKHRAGHAALMKLIARSDVLISNMRPQAMARLGLTYEDVVTANRRLIYVVCFGFGQGGPYADRPAYDDLIQTLAGFVSLFERAYDEEPKFLPSNFCDRVTGLSVVSAVTAALFFRERTGSGQSIEVPMYETMVQFLMSDHLGGYTFEPPEGPIGYQRVINPNRRPYRTTDGYLALLVYSDQQWTEFFSLIGRADLDGQGVFASIKTRGENIHEVYGFVQEMIATRSTQAWLDLFEDSDLAHAAVPTIESLIHNEHLEAVNFFQLVDHPTEGLLRTTGIPSTWSASQPDIRRLAPGVGEHSLEILRELGYDEESIGEMLRAGTTSEDQLA